MAGMAVGMILGMAITRAGVLVGDQVGVILTGTVHIGIILIGEVVATDLTGDLPVIGRIVRSQVFGPTMAEVL